MVRGLMLLSDRACFNGMQTRSSLQIGTISTEKVYLKLAVLLCVSADRSCSDALDLERVSTFENKQRSHSYLIGATLPKNSTILRACAREL